MKHYLHKRTMEIAVMSGRDWGLQVQFKRRWNQAIFIHCYAHKMNLVLKNAVGHIKECKIFFNTLSGLASFFVQNYSDELMYTTKK